MISVAPQALAVNDASYKDPDVPLLDYQFLVTDSGVGADRSLAGELISLSALIVYRNASVYHNGLGAAF